MMGDLTATSPLTLVTLAGLAVLMMGAFTGRGRGSHGFAAVVGLGFVAALVSIWWLWPQLPIALTTPAMTQSLHLDAFGLALSVVILVGSLLTTYTAVHYLPAQDSDHHEYYALIAFSTLGMMAMVMAADMLTLFVALEVMSIAIYVLAGFKRKSAFSAEAAMKYFILGSFASAILLLGIAFLYGVTGEVSFAGIGKAFHFQHGIAEDPLATIALVLVLAAFAFKVAAVPFHMWTPDVYEGSMSSVTGFMAIGVKTAAFGAFARVLLTCFGDEAFRSDVVSWEVVVGFLAVASIVGGNVMALAQKNLKRLLAYSAIAHTGYILIALLATPRAPDGTLSVRALGGGLVFYLFAYALANAAAFGVAAAVSDEDREDLSEPSYAGLARRDPLLGFVLAVSMLSLLGIPATAGFMGKLTIFREVLDQPGQGHLWLVIIAALGSVVSAWYYLRVILVAYMLPEDPDDPIRLMTSRPMRWSVVIATVLTLWFGLLPSPALDVATQAGQSLAHTTTPGVAAADTPDEPLRDVLGGSD